MLTFDGRSTAGGGKAADRTEFWFHFTIMSLWRSRLKRAGRRGGLTGCVVICKFSAASSAKSVQNHRMTDSANRAAAPAAAAAVFSFRPSFCV